MLKFKSNFKLKEEIKRFRKINETIYIYVLSNISQSLTVNKFQNKQICNHLAYVINTSKNSQLRCFPSLKCNNLIIKIFAIILRKIIFELKMLNLFRCNKSLNFSTETNNGNNWWYNEWFRSVTFNKLQWLPENILRWFPVLEWCLQSS